MDEFVVKTHDFEEAKLAIKKFSEETTTDLDFQRVSDKKGVGEWLGDAVFGGGIGFNHKVTGKELNDLTVQVESHLHSVNNTQIKLIKQFGQVYTALEALDKYYIQGILISIKATEKTSERIVADHEDIKKLQKNQKKTLEELLKFKKKLDAYAHLGDIDKIWSDCQKWHEDISALSGSISNAASLSKENKKEITDLRGALEKADVELVQLAEDLSREMEHTKALASFVSEMQRIVHLRDIDEMWTSLSDANASLENLYAELDAAKTIAANQQQDIAKALAFIEKAAQYHHLKDIDMMWDDLEDHSKKLNALTQHSAEVDETVHSNQVSIAELTDYKNELSSIAHLHDVDNLWISDERRSMQIEELQRQHEETGNLIQKNKEDVEQSLVAEQEKTVAALQQLNKKIQYAYWIAGSSTALALVELLVILLR